MTYEVLARKWRPTTFADVIGQPHITVTLQNALRLGRLHQAYLFCGPRGTGKTTTARLLAKALNCVAGPTPEPCNACDFCHDIAGGASLDMMEIDAASNTGVDDVRDLRESAGYATAAARYKIYVIDEVHRLSPQAFDALLKTLEEPPPHVIFICATTEAHRVPATIRSRCLRFDFRLIEPGPLRDALSRIAKAEELAISDDAIALLASEARGSMRDGQSLLDQVAAYGSGEITAETIAEALGLVGTQTLVDLTGTLREGDAAGVVGVLDEVSRAGRDWGQVVRQLTEHVKQLLLVRTLGDDYRGGSLTQDEVVQFKESAAGFEETDLMRLVLGLANLSVRLKASVNPRLDCEVFFLQQALADRAVDLRALVDRLEQASPVPDAAVQSGLFGNSNSAPAAHRAPPPSRPAIAKTPPPASGAPRAAATPSPQRDTANDARSTQTDVATNSGTADRSGWAEILARIVAEKPSVQAFLKDARLEHESAETVHLVVYGCNGHQESMLRQREIRELILGECRRSLGEGVRIDMRLESGPPPEDTAATAPVKKQAADLSEAANDPIVRTLLERYDGQIVE